MIPCIQVTEVTGSPAHVTDNIPYILVLNEAPHFPHIPHTYHDEAPNMHLWIFVFLPQARRMFLKVRSLAICFWNLIDFALLSFPTPISQLNPEHGITQKNAWRILFAMCQALCYKFPVHCWTFSSDLLEGSKWFPSCDEDRRHRKTKALS